MQVRTLFLSDTHLGHRQCRAGELAAFLRSVDAECIVLAGDIVDALSLARRFFWTAQHGEVLRILLAKRRAGARLVYIPGNHDASLALAAELLLGQVEVHREWVHRTAAGERLLVVHGDQFDGAMACAPWLHWVGDTLYELTVAVNARLNDLRSRMGRAYWSLPGSLKLRLRASIEYIARFERLAARHARARGYDGVVCGHIHRANHRRIETTRYCNTGDWIESCAALVESADGELHVCRWPQRVPGARAVRRASLPATASA